MNEHTIGGFVAEDKIERIFAIEWTYSGAPSVLTIRRVGGGIVTARAISGNGMWFSNEPITDVFVPTGGRLEWNCDGAGIAVTFFTVSELERDGIGRFEWLRSRTDPAAMSGLAMQRFIQ